MPLFQKKPTQTFNIKAALHAAGPYETKPFLGTGYYEFRFKDEALANACAQDILDQSLTDKAYYVSAEEYCHYFHFLIPATEFQGVMAHYGLSIDNIKTLAWQKTQPQRSFNLRMTYSDEQLQVLPSLNEEHHNTVRRWLTQTDLAKNVDYCCSKPVKKLSLNIIERIGKGFYNPYFGNARSCVSITKYLIEKELIRENNVHDFWKNKQYIKYLINRRDALDSLYEALMDMINARPEYKEIEALYKDKDVWAATLPVAAMETCGYVPKHFREPLQQTATSAPSSSP